MMFRNYSTATLLVLALVSTTFASEEDWTWTKKDGEANRAGDETAAESTQDIATDLPPASANETHARHLIKDRLCDLGLGGCGEEDDIEEKRPHVQPHDLIYAQPVHLKPIGRPIPAVPVRAPHSITPPPIIGGSSIYGPPRPVPYRPRPYKPIIGGGLPPLVYEPDREQSILQEKRPLVTGPSGSGVQTHVHHHYHHGDDKLPDLQTGTGGLYDTGNSLHSGIYSPGSSYNHYPFYKKQLNIKQPHQIGGIPSLIGGAHQPYDKYPPFEPNRGFADCYCVPYDQCAPHEIARKEDQRGPGLIDPRTNPNSDIQALGHDEIVITDGNGTMTVVKQRRQLDDTDAVNAETENKEKRKREVNEDAIAEASDKSINAKKLAGLGGGGIGDEEGDSGLKLRPTFGVSFGLPSGVHGYPINPWGQYPALNPYGSSIGGPGGVNLGLVSVNPLLSVQVSKDEYGDKVVKPLVNLHVTPNHGLVNKIGSLFHHLKEPHYAPPYLNHHHLHVHKIPPQHYPFRPSYPYAPHYSYPTYNHHHPTPSHTYIRPYYPSTSHYIRESDDYIDDEEDDYYRSSSKTGAAKRTNISRDNTNKIAFPEDRAARNKRNARQEVTNLKQRKPNETRYRQRNYFD